MFKGLADEIAFILVRDKIVDIDKRGFYAYGAEVILLNLAIVVIALMVTILSKTWQHYLAFLLVFVPLRIYTGGYHAKTSTACLVISTTLYISSIGLSVFFQQKCFNWIAVVLILLSLLSVIFLAPVEHKNNPLGKKSRKKNRIISILSASADSIIFVVLAELKIEVASSVMTFIILATLLMIIGKIQNYFQVG